MRTLQDDERISNDDDVWKTPSNEEEASRAKKTMKTLVVARRTCWSAPLGAELRRSEEDAHTLAGEKSR